MKEKKEKIFTKVPATVPFDEFKEWFVALCGALGATGEMSTDAEIKGIWDKMNKAIKNKNKEKDQSNASTMSGEG